MGDMAPCAFYGPTVCPVCGVLLAGRDVRWAWALLLSHLSVQHGVTKGGAIDH